MDEVFCQNTGFTPLTGRSPVQALGGGRVDFSASRLIVKLARLTASQKVAFTLRYLRANA